MNIVNFKRPARVEAAASRRVNLLTSLSLGCSAFLMEQLELNHNNLNSCIIEVEDPKWDPLAAVYAREEEKVKKASVRDAMVWPRRSEGDTGPKYKTGVTNEGVSPELLKELLEHGLYASRIFPGYVLYGMTAKGPLVVSLMLASAATPNRKAA